MKKLTTEYFITKAREIHGDKYDYSKTQYINAVTKVYIICPEHGEFLQLPNNHLKGCGCPNCSNNNRLSSNEYINKLKKQYPCSPYSFDNIVYKNNHTPIQLRCPTHGLFSTLPSSITEHLTECPICKKKRISESQAKTNEQFIEEAKIVHNNKYDYTKTNYINAKTKVCIICPNHGEFWQFPNTHLHSKGCPKCSNEHLWDNRKDKMTKNDFIRKAREIHGYRYDYSKVNYINSSTKVCIICPEHGEFYQTPSAHLRGQGCPKCGKHHLSILFRDTIDEFIQKANIIHNNKYDYTKVKYSRGADKVCIICPEHGEFYQTPNNHLQGHGCPLCAIGKNISSEENEISKYIRGLIKDTIILNDRNIISPNELDIYIPSRNIAFEYDGLYWHSDKFVKMDYHLLKTEKAAIKGIKLFHIFEDEWLNKNDVTKSMISNVLGCNETINIDGCETKFIKDDIVKLFINDNNINDYADSDYHIGLYNKNELLLVVSFKRDDDKGKYTLHQSCFKKYTTTTEGMSLIINKFIREIKPKEIITYIDRRWDNGDIFYKLGFKFVNNIKPNCYYLINNKRRTNINNDYCNRLYDCGLSLLKLNIKGEKYE